MQSYEWQAYDVCQVNYGDGVWMDFATIRTGEDARYARLNVDRPETAGARYAWPNNVKAVFRIVRGEVPVYGPGAQDWEG